MVLPDYAELELRVADDARCPAVVCFDGKETRELQRGDSVRVRMSPYPVPTINYADQTTDWFASIERCFRWSERVGQRPFVTPPSEGEGAAVDDALAVAADGNGHGDAAVGGAALLGLQPGGSAGGSISVLNGSSSGGASNLVAGPVAAAE